MISRLNILLHCILFLTIISCTNDKGEELSINDATLFELSNSQSGFQYYKRTTDTLVSDGSSPHGSYVRIRFNETAAGAMNSDLSNLSADRYPHGSLIVKEVYDSPGGSLKAYASLFKSTIDVNTAGGWIWAEFGPDGEVLYSSIKKGGDCSPCHASAGNVDLIRTFSLH